MKYKTIKQRLALYKRMLKDYQRSKKIESFLTSLGFCRWIVYNTDAYMWATDSMKDNFPELYKHRPKKQLHQSDLWWNGGSLEPRIKCLVKTIVLTEKLINESKNR